MKVLLIDNGTTLLEKLQLLIPGDEITHTWKDFSESDIEQADLVVLSGSSRMQLKGNEKEFERELVFIAQNKKPLIGICFGCELITEAFGGTLRELPTSHKGIRDITILEPGIFADKQSMRVFENHRWITDTVPEHFVIVAESDAGPEIIRHESLPIWGVQCHPENHVDTTEGDEFFLDLINKLLQASK